MRDLEILGLSIPGERPSVTDLEQEKEAEEPTTSIPLLCALWVFSSIFTATRFEFNTHVTGVMISFNLFEALLNCFTSWILFRGLLKRSMIFVGPWILTTTYGLYYNNYQCMVKMMRTLRPHRNSTPLPWAVIMLTSFALALRVVLLGRIFQMGITLQCRKQAEQQTYNVLKSQHDEAKNRRAANVQS